MGKTFLVGTISNTSRTAPAPRTRIYLPQPKKSVNFENVNIQESSMEQRTYAV